MQYKPSSVDNEKWWKVNWFISVASSNVGNINVGFISSKIFKSFTKRIFHRINGSLGILWINNIIWLLSFSDPKWSRYSLPTSSASSCNCYSKKKLVSSSICVMLPFPWSLFRWINNEVKICIAMSMRYPINQDNLWFYLLKYLWWFQNKLQNVLKLPLLTINERYWKLGGPYSTQLFHRIMHETAYISELKLYICWLFLQRVSLLR